MKSRGLINKIAIGSAQFGMDYGISNSTGQVSVEEVNKIFSIARQYGVNAVDTAQVYGNSEIVIGGCLSQFKKPPKITTKLFFEDQSLDTRTLLHKSFLNLKCDSVYGVLLHSFKDFKSNGNLINDLQELKNKGLINKVGFSLYDVEDLQYLIYHAVEFDIVQVPYNVFDQRFLPYFALLKDMGVEIQTRSAFLQGLFFLDRNYIPQSILTQVTEPLDRLYKISAKMNVSISDMCLYFCFCNSDIDTVVLGVDNTEQFLDNIKSVLSFNEKFLGFDTNVLKKFALEDENVILPYNW